MAGIKDFVGDKAQGLAEQADTLRRKRAEAARKVAATSAAGLKSLKEPVRSLSRSGVKLTSISQGTAQRLIELQEKIVTSALDDAAEQLERAAATESVRELMTDQVRVLTAARARIVADMAAAVAILKDAGGDVRGVAGQAYGKAAAKAGAKKSPARKKARKAPARKKAKRAVRKAGTRARAKSKAGRRAPRRR